MDEKEAIKLLLESGDLPTKEKIIDLINGNCVVGIKPDKSKLREANIQVVQTPEYQPRKIEIRDFAMHIKNRYSFMKGLLINRAEVENPMSIDKLKLTTNKTTIIAIVADIQKLATGTLKVTLEDLTGKVTGIISAKNEELIKSAGFLTLDEVAAFKGSASKDLFFVTEIIWPDIPQRTLQNAPDEVYALFSGDFHIGSSLFLKDKMENMINWLNGRSGDERQKEIAAKTKYIIVAGDVVDGVGIYPGQEKELTIKDIYDQHKAAAEYLAQIPQDKKIIVIPGNHDVVRICEPQPPIYKDIAEDLYKLPNVICLGNPSNIILHQQDCFKGFNVLLYHGYSFDYFADQVEALRLQGAYDHADKILAFLLKKRHLAPTYGSTLHLPMMEDTHIIKQVPDVIASGHIHHARIGNYKQTMFMVTAGFQAKTAFQEKVGHHPEPGKMPLLNLNTRKATMLNF